MSILKVTERDIPVSSWIHCFTILLNDVQFTAFSRISPSKCLEKYSCYTVIFSHSRVESDDYKSEQRGKLFEFSLF